MVVGHRKRNMLERWWSGDAGGYISDHISCSLLIARNFVSDKRFRAASSRRPPIPRPAPTSLRACLAAPSHMDQLAAKAFIDALWDAEVIPELTRYIRIPNKSPAFDPDWAAHGYMEAAVAQFAAWAQAQDRGHRRRKPGGGAAGGPHAGDLHRDPRRERTATTTGAALRPPRQAAGDDRLGRGLRAVGCRC